MNNEINNKLKEAHELADKELFKMYWNEKIFGVKKIYVLFTGLFLILGACVLS